jgi:hypothetical protein
LGGGLATGQDSGQPENIHSITELGSAVFGSLIIKGEVGVVFPTFLCGKVGDPGEVGEEPDRALGIFVGGEGGEVGIGDVFEFFDDGKDLFTGNLRDPWVILEGTGNGGMVDTRFFSHIDQGGSLHLLR